jgi:hypothetical protein
MGAAELIVWEEVRASKQWEALRQQLPARFEQWLDTLDAQLPEAAPTLAPGTEPMWRLGHALTGSLTETILMETHHGE